jgi:hypothetical protein
MNSSHSPQDAKRLLAGVDASWWIAGGWAIDLWLEEQTREHLDLDIAVLRTEQRPFWEFLKGWDLYQGTDQPGVLEPWNGVGVVPPPRHAIWCRPTTTDGWAFEILLNDSQEGDWLFRRDHSVSLPLETLGGRSHDGVPYLCPEVVLLYKAKNVRPNDQLDFERAADVLAADARSWLASAIERVHPSHPWIAVLRRA